MILPRHAEIWLLPYLADRIRTRFSPSEEKIGHVWFCIADHFEPFIARSGLSVARQRVNGWRKRWPEIAVQIGPDSFDAPPRHTFFYPAEQYHPELLDPLAEMTREGIGDVEVHLHHDRDTRENFIQHVAQFLDRLVNDHGLLRSVQGKTRFGFIHGNWALDNSLSGGRWCGLNDEVTLLRDLGCYADFTMPSGASPAQARTINTIYWCNDDPEKPKSYDRGIPVRQGAGIAGDLLMIPGPFGLRWKGRLLPRMETGELAAHDPPTAYRVRRWFELAPRIGGHLFVKLYSHGALESNSEKLLGGMLYETYCLMREGAQQCGAQIHFVSAWEMFQAVIAISEGNDPAAALARAPITAISYAE